MLDNLDFTKVILLLVVAMLVVGPQRLPGLIESAARLLRGARDMARTANTQLQQELGVDLDVTDLNPRTFVRKHLLTDDDEMALLGPLRDALGGMDEAAAALTADTPIPLTKATPAPDHGQARADPAST
ncbi:Sec-independent protein translocase protein TatB [Fodinicola feengrottensis]|uniref:Sec-independent protein translocase protein TatB n=1 Tax=Fodinicola feengrottensis TaxID=435914 RepID=A0ABN2GJ31_9ACTN